MVTIGALIFGGQPILERPFTDDGILLILSRYRLRAMTRSYGSQRLSLNGSSQLTDGAVKTRSTSFGSNRPADARGKAGFPLSGARRRLDHQSQSKGETL